MLLLNADFTVGQSEPGMTVDWAAWIVVHLHFYGLLMTRLCLILIKQFPLNTKLQTFNTFNSNKLFQNALSSYSFMRVLDSGIICVSSVFYSQIILIWHYTSLNCSETLTRRYSFFTILFKTEVICHSLKVMVGLLQTVMLFSILIINDFI